MLRVLKLYLSREFRIALGTIGIVFCTCRSITDMEIFKLLKAMPQAYGTLIEE